MPEKQRAPNIPAVGAPSPGCKFCLNILLRLIWRTSRPLFAIICTRGPRKKRRSVDNCRCCPQVCPGPLYGFAVSLIILFHLRVSIGFISRLTKTGAHYLFREGCLSAFFIHLNVRFGSCLCVSYNRSQFRPLFERKYSATSP